VGVIHAKIVFGLLVQLVKKYRTGLPTKFCCICHIKINRNKETAYFCSHKCYNQFRLGLGLDYSKISCKYPPKTIGEEEEEQGEQEEQKITTTLPKPGFIDYTRFNYCRGCRLKVNKKEHPRVCPNCKFRISTRKKSHPRRLVDTRIRIS
jgi:hypothetical protein